MRRWNDYYDSMDPKNKNKLPSSAEHKPNSPLKYLSVYPRKISQNHSRTATPVNIISNTSTELYPVTRATAETSNQHERYTNRRNEIGMNAHKSDGGHANFAWVD